MKLVKAQPQQYGYDCLRLRKCQGGKLPLHFCIVLVHAEHPANAVKPLRLSVQGGHADLLPSVLQPCLAQGFAQVVPRGQLHHNLVFRVFSFASFLLGLAGVGQPAKAGAVRNMARFHQCGFERFVFELLCLVGQQQRHCAFVLGQWARRTIHHQAQVVQAR